MFSNFISFCPGATAYLTEAIALFALMMAFLILFVFWSKKEGWTFMGADLPCCWSIEQFTRMVIGEEEVRDPSYLADVYSNLLECGFHSGYWEQAFDYMTLLYGFM